MKTLVVSLAGSVDRQSRVRKELEATGLTFDFFEATDAAQAGHQHADRARDEKTRKRRGYTLLAAELACFSSHYRVWERCIEINDTVLVLEDNIEFTNTVPAESLLEFIQAIPPQDYVKLTATRERRYRKCAKIDSTHSLIRYVKCTYGTGAYLLRPAGARKLINGAAEFLEPVDDYMEKPWRHGVVAYSVYPSLFRRAPIKSTIGTNRKEKKNISPSAKLYIELYRIYESVLTKLYLYS